MEANPEWFVNVWQAFLTSPLSIEANAVIVFALFIIGIGYLMRRNWQISTVIVLTLVFALLASGFHKYSLLGRMLLFAIPLFVIAISAGMAGFGSLFKHQYLSIAIQGLFAVHLMWAPVGISLDEFANPKYREHIKPTLEYLSNYIKDDDLIYVYHNTGPAFRFYAPKFGLDTANYIIGNDHSFEPEEYRDELDMLVGNKRVWLIFSHVYEEDDFNEKDYIIAYADQIGDKIREFRVSSTSIFLYLYDVQ